MKKNKILLAAGVVLLSMSVSCKKYPKPDIVKYTVNGKSYEVTGAYSDMDFKGISKNLNSSFGVTAKNEHTLSFGGKSIPSTNCYTKFMSTLPPNDDYGMFIEINRSLSTRKRYRSVTGSIGGFTITKNEFSYIEGNFSGWLYYMGMFGEEPISDSVEITNGYFYLAK